MASLIPFPNLPSLNTETSSTFYPTVDLDNKYVGAPYNAKRGLTASAVQIPLKDKKEIEALKEARGRNAWQSQAWDYSELIGEVHFAVNLIGNIISRVRLYPGYILDENAIPADIHTIDDKGISDELKADSRRALRLLATGNGGISGVMKDAAMNLFIAGECFLLQRKRPNHFVSPGPSDIWEIRSVDEFVFKTSGRKQGVYLKDRRDSKDEDLIPVEGSFLGRIWNSYARYSGEADSSLRPLLELMDELLMWNKAVRSSIKSSLNAGILFLPDTLANAEPMDGEGGDDYPDPDADSIEEALLQALLQPIESEAAATSVVPMILRGPAEVGEQIRHIELGRNVSEEMQVRAGATLDRILSGLDLPKDVISGLGSAKYANSMVIEESMYKSHIEPMCLAVVDALTAVFLKPVLRARGYSEEELERVVLWYDPSSIQAKPSKTESASIGYEQGLISGAAWRREHGFSSSDRPSQLEVGQKLAVSRGLLDEQTSAALFETLIPDIFKQIREASIEASPGGTALQEALIPDPAAPESVEIITNPEESITSDQDEAEYQGPPTGLIEPA